MPPVSTTPLAPVASKENFIERFGDWFGHLFSSVDSADSLYNTLTDDEKRAAIWGSGIIHLVDQKISALPADVVTAIQTAFPDLSIDVVHGFLDELRDAVDTTQSQIPLTLEDAVAWAQAYLKAHSTSGSIFDQIRTTAVNILVTLFSPITPIEKIITIGVGVYHLIVKPHVAAVLGTAVPSPAANELPGALPPPAVDNTPAPAATGTTATAQTPDKEVATAPAAGPDDVGIDNGSAPNDQDMDIVNETQENLAGASDLPEGDPIEEAGKVNASANLSDFQKKNMGEGVDVNAPVTGAIPTADQEEAANAVGQDAKPDMPASEPGAQAPIEEQPAFDALTKNAESNADFEARVQAEVNRRINGPAGNPPSINE